MSKDLIGINLEAVKVENDAAFSTLEGKIDALPKPPSIWQIAGVVGAALVAAVAIAAFAF